jgi:hypothetical protein
MADPTTPATWQRVAETLLPIIPPYRLDLTVTVLRRTPLSFVDILTANGC